MRLSALKFPIETGRYTEHFQATKNVHYMWSRRDGDEFQYLFRCDHCNITLIKTEFLRKPIRGKFKFFYIRSLQYFLLTVMDER